MHAIASDFSWSLTSFCFALESPHATTLREPSMQLPTFGAEEPPHAASATMTAARGSRRMRPACQSGRVRWKELPLPSAPEPARPAGRAELLLLGGVLERRAVRHGRGGLALEEAHLDLGDAPVAELGVADPRPSVRRRRLPTRDRRRDVVSHDARRRLGEDARLRDRPGAGADVA